jgi:hypothetical protein
MLTESEVKEMFLELAANLLLKAEKACKKGDYQKAERLLETAGLSYRQVLSGWDVPTVLPLLDLS